ncbi:MAG: class I SAM-dependent methyltransferase [Stenomitos frigidus ULC029]
METNPYNADAPVSYAEMWFGASECIKWMQMKIAGELIDWLPYVCKKYLHRKDGSFLVLGAGDSSIVRSLREAGYTGYIVATDIAEKGLKRLKADVCAAGFDNIDYVVADLNTYDFQYTFDTIISQGVLHHVEQTDRCLAMLKRNLAPNGFLIAEEYIGAIRFQLPEAQVAWINAALNVLPKDLRPFQKEPEMLRPATAAENARVYYVAPTEESILAYDPSEAIVGPALNHSLTRLFKVVERTGYGGTLLSYMTGHFDFKRSNTDPFALAWLKVLMQIEDTLIETGILTDEFVFYVLQSPNTH